MAIRFGSAGRRPPRSPRCRRFAPSRSSSTGAGPGPWGRWPWGEDETPRTVVYEQKPTKSATEALLDWALISWTRRHVVEIVVDLTRDEPSDDELPGDDEVLAIAHELGLEVIPIQSTKETT